jgi:phosphoglycolate phosphatase
MKLGHMIFDLDGTLWNCEGAYRKSLRVALDKNGFMDISTDSIAIGQPIENVLASLKKVPENIISRISSDFRKEFAVNDLLHSQFFEGAIDILEQMHSLDYRISIASFKREKLIHTILENANVNKLIDFVVGSREGEYIDKGGLLKKSITAAESKDCSNHVFFVGDSIKDYEASLVHNIPFVYARFGYETIDTKMILDNKKNRVIETISNMSELIPNNGYV